MSSTFSSDELEAGFADDLRVLEHIPCSTCRVSLTPDEIDCSSGRDEQPLCDACWFAAIPGYLPSSERGGK